MSNLESPHNLKYQKAINLEPEGKIKFGEKKYVYAILKREFCDHPFPQCKVTQKLQIMITEIDVAS